MVTYIPGDNSLGEAFKQAGSNVAQSFMGRADELALQNALTKLSPTASPREILDAITGVSTYSPAAKQNAIKNYIGAAEFEELKRKAQSAEDINKARNEILRAKEDREVKKLDDERKAAQSIVSQLDIPEEQKEVIGKSVTLKAAEDLLKQQVKSKGEDRKLTPFEKKVQEKNAEEYINLTKEIPKIESTLGDINYARQLSNELGVGGAIAGAVGLSGKAKELEGVSFTLMEPIVKIFNPSGPIAQQKLKMIQDKYVIKASDAPWTNKAKLDALERFAKQALGRAQKKMELIKKYDGNPPETEMEKFDRESDTISDAMIDYDLSGEESTNTNLPNPADFKGKTITSPDGQKYHSDGTRWVKK
jgi:hypothetical protein